MHRDFLSRNERPSEPEVSERRGEKSFSEGYTPKRGGVPGKNNVSFSFRKGGQENRGCCCPTTGGPVVGGWVGAIDSAWIMRAAKTFPFAWRDQRHRGLNGVSWAGWWDVLWFRTLGSGSATLR